MGGADKQELQHEISTVLVLRDLLLCGFGFLRHVTPSFPIHC
jgi:hypothetical protein